MILKKLLDYSVIILCILYKVYYLSVVFYYSYNSVKQDNGCSIFIFFRTVPSN